MATTTCMQCYFEDGDLIFAATGQGTLCQRHTIVRAYRSSNQNAASANYTFETLNQRQETAAQRMTREAETAARMHEILERLQAQARREASQRAYEHHYKRAEQAQRQTTRIGTHDWIEQAFQATPANRHEQLYRTLATFCHPDQAGSNEAFHALSAAKEKHRRLIR